ncbi:MAG: class I lanthipeptide [Hyphomicrobiales bacterium]
MKNLKFNKQTISILSNNEQQDLVGGTSIISSALYTDVCSRLTNCLHCPQPQSDMSDCCSVKSQCC